MQKYRLIHTLTALQEYLTGATHVVFDFETAPLDKYRTADKAALDAHKAAIVGVSFSVTEGDAVYLPLVHRVGENAADSEGIWDYLAGLFTDPNICKIAHNLAFESQFLYARGIIIQEPCYDTIAAAQLSYKGEKGDIILDLFGGSGTTLIAAEQTERTAHLMELDPKYADVIVKRYILQMKSDADVFLLRDSEKIPWAEVPQPSQAESVENAEAETEEAS